jgi:hypothetical protein
MEVNSYVKMVFKIGEMLVVRAKIAWPKFIVCLPNVCALVVPMTKQTGKHPLIVIGGGNLH